MSDDTVLVKRGPNGEVYHRNTGDDTPPCTVVGYDDADGWREWSEEKADAWKTPCQNPECYGDGESIGQKTGDTKPVGLY